MNTNFFDEYQKQVEQWQKQFFTTWFDNMPSASMSFNIPDSLDQTLSLQQAIVETAFKNQKLLVDMTMETQEKLWSNYFELLRKTAAMTTEEVK